MRALLLIAVLTLCGWVFLPTRAAAAAEGWMDDLGPAVARAQAEGKDILVDFTGSDWCGWCIKLHDEVFSRPEFLAYAKEHFILVALDFPRAGGAVDRAMSQALKQRNAAEAKAFEVRGYPAVLLLTADGALYARTGYQRGGPASYRAHLESFRKGADRKLVVSRAEALASADDAARLEAAYFLYPRAWTGRRAELLDVVVALDPEDREGLILGSFRDRVDAALAQADGVDWQAVVRAGRDLAARTPALDGQSLFHALLGLAAVRAEDGELARQCLTRLEALGGVKPEWLASFRADVQALR